MYVSMVADILNLFIRMSLVIVIDEVIKQLTELHIGRCLRTEIGKVFVGRMLLKFKTDDKQILQFTFIRVRDIFLEGIRPLL